MRVPCIYAVIRQMKAILCIHVQKGLCLQVPPLVAKNSWIYTTAWENRMPLRAQGANKNSIRLSASLQGGGKYCLSRIRFVNSRITNTKSEEASWSKIKKKRQMARRIVFVALYYKKTPQASFSFIVFLHRDKTQQEKSTKSFLIPLFPHTYSLHMWPRAWVCVHDVQVCVHTCVSESRAADGTRPHLPELSITQVTGCL